MEPRITFYTAHLRGPEHLADFRLDAEIPGLWSQMSRGHIMRSRDTHDAKVLWPCVGGLFMATPSTREDTEKANAWVIAKWREWNARGQR